MRPLEEVMDISLKCWLDLPRKTFESAWLICGFFSPEHFEAFRGLEPGITSLEDAKSFHDPSGVLEGSSLSFMPQNCTAYEWQIQDFSADRSRLLNQVGVHRASQRWCKNHKHTIVSLFIVECWGWSTKKIKYYIYNNIDLVHSLSEDEKGEFQSLPYEVAHGVIRLLCLHASELRDAKKTLAALESSKKSDKTTSKIDGLKAKIEKFTEMDRFIVFNRRTGATATVEWLNKHITSNDQGRPVMKNPKTRAQAWVMTLRIISKPCQFQALLRTKNTEDAPFHALRCLDIRDKKTTGKMCVLSDIDQLQDVGEELEKECFRKTYCSLGEHWEYPLGHQAITGGKLTWHLSARIFVSRGRMS